MKLNNVKFRSADVGTLELGELEHNVSNYTSRILRNLIIGRTAIYAVCVDLHNAKFKLGNSFNTLETNLNKVLSESTIRKYIEIGGSERIKDLYERDILPESWTTQYYIATLSDAEYFKADKKNIFSVACTKTDIENAIKGKTSSESYPETSKVFEVFTIPTANPEVINTMIDELNSVVKSYHKTKDDMAEGLKDKAVQSVITLRTESGVDNLTKFEKIGKKSLEELVKYQDQKAKAKDNKKVKAPETMLPMSFAKTLETYLISKPLFTLKDSILGKSNASLVNA